MGEVHHGSATTTVRRAIQHSQESLKALAKHYAINPKMIVKWKGLPDTADLLTDLKAPLSTVLSIEEKATLCA